MLRLGRNLVRVTEVSSTRFDGTPVFRFGVFTLSQRSELELDGSIFRRKWRPDLDSLVTFGSPRCPFSVDLPSSRLSPFLCLGPNVGNLGRYGLPTGPNKQKYPGFKEVVLNSPGNSGKNNPNKGE